MIAFLLRVVVPIAAIALLIYSLVDAIRVPDDSMYRAGTKLIWVLVIIFVQPFIGPIIYLFFRPPEYLEDVRERELEIRAMEENLGGDRCPVCRADVDPTFLACPVCTTKLKQACRRCKAPLEPLWQVCPYCETPVEATPRAVENL